MIFEQVLECHSEITLPRSHRHGSLQCSGTVHHLHIQTSKFRVSTRQSHPVVVLDITRVDGVNLQLTNEAVLFMETFSVSKLPLIHSKMKNHRNNFGENSTRTKNQAPTTKAKRNPKRRVIRMELVFRLKLIRRPLTMDW